VRGTPAQPFSTEQTWLRQSHRFLPNPHPNPSHTPISLLPPSPKPPKPKPQTSNNPNPTNPKTLNTHPTPTPPNPQSPRGHEQAHAAGLSIRSLMQRAARGTDYRLYFYISPYLRSRQTYEGIRSAFAPQQIAGMQEDVQLREQDFGGWSICFEGLGWGTGGGGGGVTFL